MSAETKESKHKQNKEGERNFTFLVCLSVKL